MSDETQEPERIQGLEIALKLIPAVEEQLASRDTPYVKQHFDRLLKEEDCDEQEAKEMIALCLADEIERMERENDRQFNQTRYQMMLGFLPKLPDA